jgi:hypothetical protein
MNYYMRPEDQEARRQRSNTNILLTALLVCVVILTIISVFEVVELLRFLSTLSQATTSIFGNGS